MRIAAVAMCLGGLGGVRAAAQERALLTDAERTKLVQTVQADAAAAALYAGIHHEADRALAAKPHPIAKISSEGKLDGDPLKVATGRALRDLREMWALEWAYAVSGEAKYAQKEREFVLAWAAVNHPTGDPIDETNLEPLIVGYDFTREVFSAEDRKAADDYLRRVVTAELTQKVRVNNWQSHRYKIVGLSAYVLRDDALAAKLIAQLEVFLGHNLYPDGSSLDFHERDALHYHVYDLEPLLTFAIAAQRHGVDLYHFQAKNGASIRQSVQFLLPYCLGEKQHPEFVHSTVKFDRQRASNGQSEYKSGHLFEPASGFNVLCLASHFDPSVEPGIEKLAPLSRNTQAQWNRVLAGL